MALGRDERVDGEGGASAQNRADIVRVGDLIEHQHQAVRGQIRDVDWRERPRLEQEPLVDRFAGRARGNFLGAHDPRLEPAGGDFGAEPLGGRGVA